MKKILTFTLVSVFLMLLQSCGAYYEYIQILSTKPINNVEKTTLTNGGVLYEDENCAVFYKFWDKGGDAGFEFYNKTDEIIYLDLTKTFFIKNGIAYDYYEDKTVTDTETRHTSSTVSYGYAQAASRTYSASISQYYAGNLRAYTRLRPSVSLGASRSLFGSLFGMSSTSTSYGHSTSIAITDKPILAIPPKSSKFVKNYSIISNEFVSCDLVYYPINNDSLSFDVTTSPVTFSNYITYTKGKKSEEISIENQFYVDNITNYATQEVTTYVKREQTCENILTPDEITNQKTLPDIYDAYITAGDASSFYMPYKVYSTKALYKKRNTDFIWSDYYNGYTYIGYIPTNSSWTSTSSSKSKTAQTMSEDDVAVVTQNHLERLHRLSWQNSVLGLAYETALQQLDLIEDKGLANNYLATINILLDKVFSNQISKDTIERKIATSKNKNNQEEYRILLDIAKEY